MISFTIAFDSERQVGQRIPRNVRHVPVPALRVADFATHVRHEVPPQRLHVAGRPVRYFLPSVRGVLAGTVSADLHHFHQASSEAADDQCWEWLASVELGTWGMGIAARWIVFVHVASRAFRFCFELMVKRPRL